MTTPQQFLQYGAGVRHCNTIAPHPWAKGQLEPRLPTLGSRDLALALMQTLEYDTAIPLLRTLWPKGSSNQDSLPLEGIIWHQREWRVCARCNTLHHWTLGNIGPT
ncbi:hypothetical protein BDR06DRAFT_972679 [Suillus hirtellus]|nr:hypothetical protein BDR06DRAFT_972679 [Suillus hirtellus]